MKPSVYLFGPLLGQTFKETIYWRKLAEIFLSPYIETFSPTRGIEVQNAEEPFKAEYEEDLMHLKHSYTIRDLHDIIQTNAMLGNFDGTNIVSKGSLLEIGYGRAMNKPVVAAMPKDNIHNHPMIDEMVLVAPNLFEAMRAIMFILLPSSILSEINFKERYEETEKFLRNQSYLFWRKG